jgi:hypothetical protein
MRQISGHSGCLPLVRDTSRPRAARWIRKPLAEPFDRDLKLAAVSQRRAKTSDAARATRVTPQKIANVKRCRMCSTCQS